jgi:hypothetical protein
MTATDTTVRIAVPHRELTQAEFLAEGTTLFGPDLRTWGFQCPTCGAIATAADFPPGKGELAPVECLGRHGAKGRCKRAAYGFIPGPWFVRQADGTVVGCFPFAPAPPQEPQSAPRHPAATPGPGSPESPSAAPLAAIPTPSSEFLGAPSAPEWLPMDEAPQDGTVITGLINGDETPIRWSDEDRHCMLAYGNAPGAGTGFGPGWIDDLNGLVVIDEPEGWHPADPAAESGA